MATQEIAISNNKERWMHQAYPWLVWFLGAMFFFYKYVLQVSPSVMSAELMQTFNMTGASLGNLAACFFYAYLLMQIPVGLLLDKYGPRLVMPLAIFICALGTFLFARAESIAIAGISRFLIGLGCAFAAVSCFKLAAVWFPPKRFALIAGMSMTAGMLGAVGGEAPLSLMVNHAGWRQALVDVAMLGFILMVLSTLIVRNKSSVADNYTFLSARQLWMQIKKIVGSKQTWLLSFYSGLAFAPVSVFGGLWGVAFLKQSYHLTANNAASAISFIFIGFAIGCPITGWLSDHLQRRKSIMFVGTTLAFLTMLIMLYSPSLNESLLMVCMLIFGIGASCFFLCFSMIREIQPIIFAGTVLGFMNMFDSICEAVTEPLIGKLLDWGWGGAMLQGARIFSLHDYHVALALLPLYFALALVLLFFIQETYCQQTV